MIDLFYNVKKINYNVKDLLAIHAVLRFLYATDT